MVELDTGGEGGGGKWGKWRGVGGGVLQKVKSVLREDEGGGEKGSEAEEDGMWVNGLK